MPDPETEKRARDDARRGKAASTQAGEFVREEIHHIREGKHGAASTKQAIAIGLSKARRAGVKLQAPREGRTSAQTREQAQHELARGQSTRPPSKKRSLAVRKTLQKKGHSAASSAALSRQARESSRQRSPRDRHQSAVKAVRTKGKTGLRRAARKAARTRTHEG